MNIGKDGGGRKMGMKEGNIERRKNRKRRRRRGEDRWEGNGKERKKDKGKGRVEEYSIRYNNSNV